MVLRPHLEQDPGPVTGGQLFRDGTEPEDSEPWLIFAGQGKLGETLKEMLETNGAPVTLVQPGSGYRSLDTRRYSLDPGEGR